MGYPTSTAKTFKVEHDNAQMLLIKCGMNRGSIFFSRRLDKFRPQVTLPEVSSPYHLVMTNIAMEAMALIEIDGLPIFFS